MSPLHLYYLTRWALRNEPALGFVMLPALATLIGFGQAKHEIVRQHCPRIAEYLFVAIIPEDSK